MSRAALVLVAITACTGADPEQPIAGAPGDIEAYARDVHPILEARCATLDCHGDAGRPLRLFAETGLRAADDLRGAALTALELHENARALLAVDPGASPAASLVLQKPLRGGVVHEGGEVWPAAGDPQPTCLAGWLAGAHSSAVAAACAAAQPQVALPPP